MNNILPLLLALFISFNQIYGNNVTTPTTTGPGTTTTEMYTSIDETLPDLTDMAEMPMCIFEYDAILEPSEGIDINICGYKNNKQVLVDITFDLPLDRWVSVGFILPGAFQEDNPMANVYSFLMYPGIRGVEERYNISDNGDEGIKLEKTTKTVEDKYEGGIRMLTLQRNSSISFDGLSIDYKQYFEEYFNFTKFSQCDEEIKIVYAFAKKENSPFSDGYGGNTGVITAKLTSRDDKKCEELIDGDIRNTPLSIICIVIMSIIAILFN